MRKGKEPDPDPYLWSMDPDPGGPKKWLGKQKSLRTWCTVPVIVLQH
jgi:hypothetical protein